MDNTLNGNINRVVKENDERIRFKSIVDSPCGIRYMFDTLNIYSGYARRIQLDSYMMVSEEEIKRYYRVLKEIYDVFCSKAEQKIAKEHMQHKFCDLKDINGTLDRLASGGVADDIELFEIKALSLLCMEVKEILEANGIKSIEIPDLNNEISILDPDGLKIRSFYIYDSYSQELRQLREKIKRSEIKQDLELEEKEIERKIREKLSAMLLPSANKLYMAMRTLGELDIYLAKAEQMSLSHLVFPQISDDGSTSYKEMFHPFIKSRIGEEFVPIDIEFNDMPVVINGANMGGKTVTLMMCALCQYLFQFGFGIPAKKCSIDIKDAVYLTIGDGQNIAGGYSSFAAEMISVNKVIEGAERGEKLLALIDEPARTTNPIEGRALVQGLLDRLRGYVISVIISTHYNTDDGEYKRLRVSGFEDGKMNYRLIEAKNGDVPHEAVKIAQILGIDEKWLESARKYLKN